MIIPPKMTIEEFYDKALEHAGDESVGKAREHLTQFDCPVVSAMMPTWRTLIEKMATRRFKFQDAEAMYSFLSALTGDSVGVVDAVVTSTVTNGQVL